MIHARSLRFLFLAGAIFCSAAGDAQETSTPISTERPSVGASADLIPGGSLQSETGTNLSLQRHAYTTDAPENLLRYGLSDRIELRFQSNNAVMEHAHSGPSVLDSQDAAISGKILLAPPNRIAPRSAIVTLSLPTGGDGGTSGSYDPGVELIWVQNLPRGVSLIESPAVTLTTFDGGRRTSWAESTSVSRALSPALTAFAELAPSRSAEGQYVYVFDAGLTLAVSPVRQLDFRVGFQRDSAGSHTLLSLGYSFRADRFLSRAAGSMHR